MSRRDRMLKPGGNLTYKAAERAACAAIKLWLAQSETLTGEDRTLALATADEIREASGLRWADLFGDRRAA